MKRIEVLAVGLVGVLLLVPAACRKKSPAGSTGPSPSAKKVLYWYDPMKPEVHFDKPGKSPFMDTQLVAKYSDETQAPAASGQKKGLYWDDPPKPEGHFDKPGKSPFMDMQLGPKNGEEPT